jgi:tetratricopeptide (TPR) repeat protein
MLAVGRDLQIQVLVDRFKIPSPSPCFSVVEIPFRKILGLNQQTYQQLKLALSLNLRRQIFIGVCDDLILRDRMATQLQAELEQLSGAIGSGDSGYPRLVSLRLNLNDPNPLAQLSQWLAQTPPPKINGYYAPLPAFQILGVEQLTRQPAAQQRRFLTHLQSIERNLPLLESSLLLWMSQPWFCSIPQSVPEFWRCRTGVFEFVGDPTPLLSILRPVRKSGLTLTGGDSRQSTDTQTVAIPIIPIDRPLNLMQGAAKPQEEADHAAETPDLAQPVTAQLKTSYSDNASFQIAVSAQVADTQTAIATDPADPTDRSTPAQPLALSAARIAVDAAFPDKAAFPIKVAVTEETDSDADQSAFARNQAAIFHNALISGDQALLRIVQQIEQQQRQETHPDAIAALYQSLGDIYRNRIEQGDASVQNLMRAIQAYEQVLACASETAPFCTDVLNDLGNLYWMLSRSGNLEAALLRLKQAIQFYQVALTKSQNHPQAYPMIQNNLGAAYADLARYQNPAENLQQSIQSYQQALHHRQPDIDPLRYASTQNNLGTTYWNLAQYHQPVVNLKQAIAAYSEALCYYTSEQEPMNYAMLQNNLGTAYWNLAQHERPQDWLRLALTTYHNALRYRTLELAPAAFAATQSNLGTACWHLSSYTDDPEVRFDYLQQAIAAYQSALMAVEQLANSPHPTALTFDMFATHNNLGLAHYQIATDPHFDRMVSERSMHLESALHHHLQALQGWDQQPDLRQTALSCVQQTVQAFYAQYSVSGQNLALSKIPGHLLPELLPQL